LGLIIGVAKSNLATPFSKITLQASIGKIRANNKFLSIGFFGVNYWCR
jgi:hypothetical protein